MKKITLCMASATLLLSSVSFGQTAKIQAVHNSPDAALSVIDVYLGDVRIIDNIGFRIATPFLDAPADVPLTFTIAPGDSESVSDGIYSATYTFGVGTNHIITANGIYSETGYSPAPPFEMRHFAYAFDDDYMPGYAGLLVNHGCTDCGNINVAETSIPMGTFIYDMPYPMFTAGYQSMPVMNYVVQVTTTTGGDILGSYEVPLATMEMDNKAAIILSSGFAHPENNGNGASFGLFMVATTGGYFIPLQSTMGQGEFGHERLSVHPNPASDIVNLEIASDVTGSLYDMSGREVLKVSGSRLDVSGLANGVFVLNAEAGGKVFTQKIVVQH